MKIRIFRTTERGPNGRHFDYATLPVKGSKRHVHCLWVGLWVVRLFVLVTP